MTIKLRHILQDYLYLNLKMRRNVDKTMIKSYGVIL